MPLLHPDRLFPAEPEVREIARRIFSEIRDLPILSPHGHTDPRWFAEDTPFPDPTALFLLPDHYILRMLYSQGIAMETLREGADPKKAQEVWRLFAAHYSPVPRHANAAVARLRLPGALRTRCAAEQGNRRPYWETISEQLATKEFRPRALYERFRMEVIATTDNALDNLEAHAAIRNSGWKGRVIPTFRPDAVVDPEFAGFRRNLADARRPDGRGHIDLEGLSVCARSRGGASSNSRARPRRTTAIRRQRRSTFPGPKQRRCSGA